MEAVFWTKGEAGEAPICTSAAAPLTTTLFTFYSETTPKGDLHRL